ncbi:hypothetical protein Tco_1002675 [Tanacetum coccineum]|uniref:Xylulose kinase-1 n=1 Tax=Tanacetum coccineum TaxID=301880 RepID=A0ABQ5F8T3_9ASTR
MSDLKFADTHNLVAFLFKPAESEGFEQIVDFLNVNPIKYALTVNPTIYCSCIKQFWDTVKTKTVNGEVQLQALVDRKKVIITKSNIRRDLRLEDAEVGDMSHHKRIYVTPSHTKKIFGNMKREGKGLSGTVTPLFPTMMVQAQEEMGEGSAIPTDPHHTPIITQPSTSQPQEKQKPRKPKRKDTESPQPSGPTTSVADEAFNEENVSKHSNDQLLSDLETSKTAQAYEITSLKLRVKKLKKKGGSRTHKLKRLYKVGRSARVVSSDEASLGDQEDASKQGRKIDDINADARITLDSNHFDADADMFGVHDLDGDEVVIETEKDHEVVVESEVVAKKKDDEVFNEKEVPIEEVSVVGTATTVSAATITKVDITLAQALAELKSTKPTATTTAATIITAASTRPKAKGLVIDDQEQAPTPTPIVSSQQSSQVKDKGKAEFDEEVRLAREKDKANIALIEEWNDIQAEIETDYELAQRLQAEEQEELTIEERPPTRAQQRSIMCTYLKNIEGKKVKDLKKLSFDSIKKMFDIAFKRVNTFVDFRTELVEGTEMKESSKKAEVMEELAQESSSKRAGDELEQENAKKQKVDDDQETAKMKELMKIVFDEEAVAINDIPLATL